MHARIDFGAAEPAAGGERAYFVRDDGAGFDPGYAGKLFGSFQRRHSRSQLPGTGIDLASVRRINENHGGSVWAEGAVGRDAVFCFTLPARADGTPHAGPPL
jgi:light-regulated signal transduction histidine kinase (bacteriophytochrome)